MDMNEFKIDDNELQALYIYLSFSFPTMKQEEQDFWYKTMQMIDKQFNEKDNDN